jgi:hypothetical protein
MGRHAQLLNIYYSIENCFYLNSNRAYHSQLRINKIILVNQSCGYGIHLTHNHKITGTTRTNINRIATAFIQQTNQILCGIHSRQSIVQY